MRTPLKIGERTLQLSNLDKVLWPRDGYTKGDLINYYRSVANWIVLHLRDRPLTLQRFPDGIDEPSFFEKGIPRGAPEWIRRVTTDSPGGRKKQTTYVLCDDEATLVYLANLASIVLHEWISRTESLEEPDFILFDLDPGDSCTLSRLARVAYALYEILSPLGLHPLAKSSGATGMHVVVPLKAGYTYDTARLFTELVAHRVKDVMGDEITLERTIAKRSEFVVYFDYQQVGRGKTIVPPYCVRARDGAPVSMPYSWDEVKVLTKSRVAQPWKKFSEHTIETVPGWLAKNGDPWDGRGWQESRLEPAIEKAQKLWR